MKDILDNMEEILNQQIVGFHQYVLTTPVHLSYVSQNLCDLLGVPREELLDDSADRYALRVHPDDRKKYSDFLQRIIMNEQSLTGEYRLVKKDGTIL